MNFDHWNLCSWNPGSRHSLNFLLPLLLGISFTPGLSAQEWTRFRGPNGTGVSEAKSIPAKFDDSSINWKKTLPGTGISSPVIWGEKLFVTCANRDKQERSLCCINIADGEILWQNIVELAPYKHHKNNDAAASTPAVDEQHVYVLWQGKQSSELRALDHTGKLVWKYALPAYKGGHGPATSPVVVDEMVVICNDHEGPSALIAVDRQTGKELWQVKRSGHRACYSVPCVYTPPGQEPQLIFVHSYQGIWGVNQKTGEKIWSIDVFGTFPQRAVASPVIADDLVIGVSGFTTAEKNVVAVKPSAGHDSTLVEEVYRISKTAPHIPTPVVYAGKLYLWTDRGIVSCAEAKTGKTLWVKRVGGNYFGSPVCVDGRLYCVDDTGEVVVVATEDGEVLARNPLNETCRSTPAVSGGVMYIHTENSLVSIGGQP